MSRKGAKSDDDDLTFNLDLHEEEELEDNVSSSIRSFTSFFVEFLKDHTCYDIMPQSSKTLVLHEDLSVYHAFRSLVENDMKSASIWDGSKFVNQIDVTDFIEFILYSYTKNDLSNSREELPEAGEISPSKSIDQRLIGDLNRSIKEWKVLLAPCKNIIHGFGPEATPGTSLFTCIELILTHRLRRLPVLDENGERILHMITLSRVLRFFVNTYLTSSSPQQPSPQFTHFLTMAKKLSIHQLRVGTYENVVMAFADTPFIGMLQLVSERRLSAIPIVNEKGQLLSKFVKSDIKIVANHRMFRHLDQSVKNAFIEVLNVNDRERAKKIYTATKRESLYDVMEIFSRTRVFSLIIVDADDIVVGVVSLSDLFKFFLNWKG